MPDRAQELKRFELGSTEIMTNCPANRARRLARFAGGPCCDVVIKVQLDEDARRIPEIAEDRGMGGNRVFVELDPESRYGRDLHVPVDDLERLLHIAMGVLFAAVRVLSDQEIWCAGGD